MVMFLMGVKNSGNRSCCTWRYGVSVFVKAVSILVLGMLATGQSVFAQNDEVAMATLRIAEEPRIAQGEIIADREGNRDANGRLAAGLFIQTDLTGLSFNSSNGIIKTTQQAGEYLLFLSPDERKVTIYREGFMPFDLILSEHGISLSSGQVWEIGITGDRKLEEIPTNIVVTPGDATIRIDGEIQEQVNPIPLAIGSHLIQIQKEGFGSVEDTVEVSTQSNLFSYNLEQVTPQVVNVTTNPSGAQVFIDGEDVGYSPIQKFEYPGQYAIRIVMDGFQEVRDQIVINEGGDNAFDFDLPKKTGTLNLSVTPADARVVLNGTARDASKPIELIPGPYKMEVSAEGYISKTESFEINMNQSMDMSVALQQITGDLTVTVKPLTANVRLLRNGNTVREWRGLEFVNDIRTGNYTLEVSAPNYITKTQTIVIEENVNREIQVELSPRDGLGMISINGLPWNAKVKVDGPGGSDKSYDKLPASAQAMPFGQYTVTVKKKGFKSISRTLQLNQPEVSVNLRDAFQPKSKGVSLGLMLLVPGGGHFYMGRSGRGLLYLLATGAAVGYTLSTVGTLQSEVEAYNDALNSYQNATNNFDQAWGRVMESYDAKEAAKEQLVIGVSAFLGIRALELIDNLFYPSPARQLQKVQVRSNGSGLSMRYNF